MIDQPPVRRRPYTPPAPPRRGFTRDVLQVILTGTCILFFANQYIWQNFNIPTESMENSLLIGDHLTVNTFIFQGENILDQGLLPYRGLTRGDVVVFKYPRDPRQHFIKRCIAVPGDRFEIRGDQVVLNDQIIQEPYAYYKRRGRPFRDRNNRRRPLDFETQRPGTACAENLYHETIVMADIRERTKQSLQSYRHLNPALYEKVITRLDRGPAEVVPEGFYLVMGDNRNNSADSRTWGLVPIELIHGRAWFVWWSYGQDPDAHLQTFPQRVRRVLGMPISIFTRTRVDESLSLVR